MATTITTPLLPGPLSQPRLDPIGLRCLLIQHFSSAWGDRTAEFSLYLYLILYFRDTLLPSSLLGFAMTTTGILWSRWAGSLVDKYDKLKLVRTGILVQKLSALSAYISCALMLSPQTGIKPLSLIQLARQLISDNTSPSPSPSPSSSPSFLQPLFGLLLLSACILTLSNTCISIAVERDWTTIIAQSHPDPSTQLTKLNTYLRQINLLCKLCAPLFVSFLTVKFDHDGDGEGGRMWSVYVLGVGTVVSMVFEVYWIGVVYRRFAALGVEQARKDAERERERERERVRRVRELAEDEDENENETEAEAPGARITKMLNIQDWKELVHLPIFYSSLSISLLYLTVLSFDGIMVGYLKTISFSDDFIAEMRGLCVITGLMGTALARPLERRIGSVRAGNWSIWSMVFCLVPVIVAFYAFAPGPSGHGRPALGVVGALLLFGGMALSRIGLWSFDLIQTKQLQVALTSHPKRNTLTGLQYTMQNTANLIKFIVTMILYQPSQFRWAATVSFASVSTGAMVYMVYVKKERGHIMHLDWVRKVL